MWVRGRAGNEQHGGWKKQIENRETVGFFVLSFSKISHESKEEFYWNSGCTSVTGYL